MLLKIEQGVVRGAERFDRHLAISTDRHVLQAAKRSGVLVLFAHRTPEKVHFYVACFGSILLGCERLSLIRVDCPQEIRR